MRRRQLIGVMALMGVGLLGCKADEAQESTSPDSGAKVIADSQGADALPHPDTALLDVVDPPPEDAGGKSSDVTSPLLDGEPPPIDALDNDAGPEDKPKEPIDGQLGEGTPSDLFPPPAEPAPRDRRRVNLDQLQAAILITTGLETWVANKENLIEKNALSLGRPDYETSVSEALEPGMFFDKLLGDSAREICPQLMKKEQAAAAEERIFIKHAGLEDTIESAPENIEKNMRMVLLRFHGNYLPPNSPQLDPWLTLFKTVTNDSTTPNPVDGWSVVCTTLMSHPDFISY